MEVEAAGTAFINYIRVERALSANTLDAYSSDMFKFTNFLRERKMGLAKVQRDDVVDFLSSLYRRGLDSRSVARHLVTVRSFFKFLVIDGVVRHDPTMNLESPKIRQSLPSFLSVKEIEKLLALPDLNTPLGLRDRALLDVLYSCGLRVTELISLRADNVDFELGCIRCIGKGDKERLVPHRQEGFGVCGQVYYGSASGVIAQSPARQAQQRDFPEPARRSIGPRGSLENFGGLRTSLGLAQEVDAAQAASQFCDASAGSRRGFALCANDAGPR